VTNPFIGDDVYRQARMFLDETNSLTTNNPQYYHYKQNGQIGFGQKSSSRVSDRIYEKAPEFSPDNASRAESSELLESAFKGENQKQRFGQKPSREEQMDAEIRRLEELNRMEAQRLREPMTTDESRQREEDSQLRQLNEEETKNNCPDEFNLLSASVSNE